MTSQNIYEYKKVKILDKEQIIRDMNEWKSESSQNRAIIRIINKLNELTIEQNHLMKDFELYKKAFKQYVSGGLLPLGWGDDLDDKTSRQPIFDFHLTPYLKDAPTIRTP